MGLHGSIVPRDDSDDSYEELLIAYQQGDHDAARRLIGRATPVLFRSVRPFVNGVTEAEEILQEAWLRVHSSRQTYRGGAPALPWLLAIVRYTRMDYFRRHYRRRETALDALPAEPPVETPRDSGDLSALLAELPESQREVLLMLKAEGLSLEEAARATGSTVGAVKQKASRGYARLREILSRKGAPR